MKRDAQRVRVGLLTLAWLIPMLVAGPPRSFAQTVSEDQVKAAYVYNFAKFVEWPAIAFPSPTAPFRLCVLGEKSFQSELDQVIKGKTVAGRPVTMVPAQVQEQFRSCHILFIASSQNKQVQRILESLRDSSVLTVGEAKNFIEQGGIINLVLEDDRVQFQVNHKAATQAGLRISSRLLTVAKLVIE